MKRVARALPCRSGKQAGKSNILKRWYGVLADDTQNAFSERLLGEAGGNAGVLKSSAVEPRLGGTPVQLCFPSDSWRLWSIG